MEDDAVFLRQMLFQYSQMIFKKNLFKIFKDYLNVS